MPLYVVCGFSTSLACAYEYKQQNVKPFIFNVPRCGNKRKEFVNKLSQQFLFASNNTIEKIKTNSQISVNKFENTVKD